VEQVTEQKTVSRFQEFLEGLRTEATRVNYSWGIKYVLKDPDEFLILAKRDRKKELVTSPTAQSKNSSECP
jgi:hypothetical protein